MSVDNVPSMVIELVQAKCHLIEVWWEDSVICEGLSRRCSPGVHS